MPSIRSVHTRTVMIPAERIIYLGLRAGWSRLQVFLEHRSFVALIGVGVASGAHHESEGAHELRRRGPIGGNERGEVHRGARTFAGLRVVGEHAHLEAKNVRGTRDGIAWFEQETRTYCLETDGDLGVLL